MRINIVFKAMAFLLTIGPNTYKSPTSVSVKQVSKDGMTIKWEFKGDRIFFQMSAPTKGWLAIGFNDSDKLTGTYLLMGNVINGKANVVEHYTRKPGDYLPISELGDADQVKDIHGKENNLGSTISFSIPIMPKSKFKKYLKPSYKYSLLIAYSQEDDFQHHSIKRTAMPVVL